MELVGSVALGLNVLNANSTANFDSRPRYPEKILSCLGLASGTCIDEDVNRCFSKLANLHIIEEANLCVRP